MRKIKKKSENVEGKLQSFEVNFVYNMRKIKKKSENVEGKLEMMTLI